MAKYDSLGYQDQLPGFAPRSSHDYGSAPGSAGVVQSERDASLGVVTVTNLYQSGQTAQPTARVGDGDTSSFPDDVAIHEPLDFSGVTGASQTGAGRGRARQASQADHPNSLGTGG